ncbi:MAG: trimethylamine methyltransferase family protein, partial [Phycisphaerae bacterium]|nr:trimethylamine methyltransferase family protein [Phycisphaerae bacterium]
GTLSLDNIFSPEQLLIDKDIVDYIQHFIKGFEFDPESSPTELIREGMSEGGFLGHRTTVANFRDVYMFPELFEHSVFSQWHRDGEKSLRSRARDIAKEKIAAHNFRLPADKQAEVDKIYQRAAKSLVG